MKNLLISIIAIPSLLLAEDPALQDITLKDGTVLKAATIKETNPLEASIIYEDGAIRVPLENMPADFVAKLGYTEADASAWKDKEAGKEVARQDAAKLAAVDARKEWKTVYLNQIIDGGAICAGDLFIAGDFSGKVDGDLWEGWAWKIGTFSFTTVMGAKRTIPKWTTLRDDAITVLKDAPLPTKPSSPIVQGLGAPPLRGY